MHLLIEGASKFFSFAAILGYILGAINAVIIVYLLDRANHTDQLKRMRLMAIVWAVAVLFVGYVAVGIERNTVCIYEVLNTVAERGKLSDDADDKTEMRDDSVIEWIKTKDNPPPYIAVLKWESSERQKWIHDQDNIYVNELLKIQAERHRVLSDRASKQIPESRCARS